MTSSAQVQPQFDVCSEVLLDLQPTGEVDRCRPSTARKKDGIEAAQRNQQDDKGSRPDLFTH
jgi:hypothetical protein